MTAAHVREVVKRLQETGQHRPGDPDILIVFDAGHHITRLDPPPGPHTDQLKREERVVDITRLDPPPGPHTRAGRPLDLASRSWVWAAMISHVQDLAEDLRRPWEKPAAQPRRLTPARVRQGCRNLRPTTPLPAGAPKPSRPGPGRPPGTKNKQCAARHDVGKHATTRPSKPDTGQKSS
ncbi:hypothetical protein [Mycobacterium shinjukuense]|uniref:Uncharacterized protein n=1 Tax=Mycobacterium shinjukuense TaxID=398694 RepID=A0A7I7MSF0_9MYCO|nr:hypothetical protein [Mycobacterium shinjukuense]ORB72106.1 hypothetical protein BST45_01655 [Mycobacterium shinjukuense]BBX74880.1 hypothetical protein MSHI_27860 [Mycobacterium shinjukuense]